MHDLMVACQEISYEDVERFRSSGQFRSGGNAEPETPSAGPVAPAVSDASNTLVESATNALGGSDKVFAALAWATHLNPSENHALLVKLASSLPGPVVEEQVRLYEAECDVVANKSTTPTKLLVYPHLLKSRMQVAQTFHEYFINQGWDVGERLPRGIAIEFAKTLLWPINKDKLAPSVLIRRWHQLWLATTGGSAQQHSGPIVRSTSKLSSATRRRSCGTQGAPTACSIVREQLYEWFAKMRYSIDWKACVAQPCRSRGKPPCMARFTRSLLRNKLNQLLHDYCAVCLLHGIQPVAFQATSKWFKAWEVEYGLNIRAPNRKYKVPKAILAERLEIGWCNVARVRALCFATQGYDPHIDNWDQSPFHNNESGSQNQNTLAVAGGLVPLIEGHADTRERWTGNFTTISDKARLETEGPPYAQFMFKGGEVIARRLR